MSACTFILLFTGEHSRDMEGFISPRGHIEQGSTNESEMEIFHAELRMPPGDT